MQTITGPNLTHIYSDFELRSLPLLDTLNLPRLRLTGKVWWEDLPLLRNIPVFYPNSIAIKPLEAFYPRPRLAVDSTGLDKIDYFYLDDVDGGEGLANIEIVNNVYLEMISFRWLENGPKKIKITGNGGEKGTVFGVEDLRTVGMMDLMGVSGASSLFSLRNCHVE